MTNDNDDDKQKTIDPPLLSCSPSILSCTVVVGPGVRPGLSQGPHTDSIHCRRDDQCYDLHFSGGQVRS